jgi:hypothetical protein
MHVQPGRAVETSHWPRRTDRKIRLRCGIGSGPGVPDDLKSGRARLSLAPATGACSPYIQTSCRTCHHESRARHARDRPSHSGDTSLFLAPYREIVASRRCRFNQIAKCRQSDFEIPLRATARAQNHGRATRAATLVRASSRRRSRTRNDQPFRECSTTISVARYR